MAMSPHDRLAVARARERFATGEYDTSCVRTEIVQSWLRCRDSYDVDPDLRLAPPASDEPAHGLELEVALAELSGIARSERSNLGPAVVTVVDGTGRLIAAWGDVDTQRRIAEANLAPWAAWSESASGTNGMGTALQCHGLMTVRGPEHWCQGFQQLDCAGIAVHDPVTDEPLGAMNVSTWNAPLPSKTPGLLRSAASTVERTLNVRSRYWAEQLVARFYNVDERKSAALAAVDPGGKMVAVNERAARLLGTPFTAPAIDPAERTKLDVPELDLLVTRAVRRAHGDQDWIGTTRLSLPSAVEPIDTSIAPVCSAGHPIGALLTFGSSEGEPLSADLAASGQPTPARIFAQRGDRTILLEPGEIRYAEANRNTVWLQTDRGRLRAATRGLHNVERQLGDESFMRVHRRYLVNVGRVREFERGFNGELLLITDVRDNQIVPVSRTRAKMLRRKLGM